MNHRKVAEAGELRVASELLLRDFNPTKAFVDDGVDLMLENGLRIQVKTSHLLKTHGGRENNPDRYYMFNFKSWHNTEASRAGVFKKQTPRLVADFAICWGIEDDIFFIIPAPLLQGKATWAISPRKGPFVSYVNNWSLLSG